MIPTGPDARLLVRPIPATGGRTLIGMAPQYAGKLGEWRLQHSGLGLTPAAARELAPALHQFGQAPQDHERFIRHFHH